MRSNLKIFFGNRTSAVSPITATADLSLDDFIVDALANNGIDAIGSAVLADVAADGNSNAEINAVAESLLADQTVDANANAEINAAGDAALNDQTIDASSNASLGADAANAVDEIIVSAIIDNAIIAEAQAILDDAAVSGNGTVTEPAIIAVISDLTLTGHPENVRAALIAGAGGLLTSANVVIRNGGFSADIEYARSVGAQMVIRSTTSLSSFIATALDYYKNHGIQSFIPAGSNSPGEIFESNGGANLPSIIVTGAGDVNNETGDDIEFFSPDPITIEPDASSFSNGYIAGQIFKIKSDLNCSWWEARYRARMTGSEAGVWDEVNGFGLIDVAAAVLFGGSIPEDPYAGIIRTVTALLELADFIISASILDLLQPKIIFNGRRVLTFKGDKKKYTFSNKRRVSTLE
ncbi:MAG: hypothetical protein Q8L88_02290 [Bacteroidota bacterium]|nr:hypothetical protein [Bacteroidota bacterium]